MKYVVLAILVIVTVININAEEIEYTKKEIQKAGVVAFVFGILFTITSIFLYDKIEDQLNE